MAHPWTAGSDPGEYSAEASDLGTSPYCPQCERWLVSTREAHTDAEGEVTHWTVTCACSAVLTIWND